MYLNQFESSDAARLSQVLATLKNIHGVRINIDLKSPSAISAIEECQSSWVAKRDKVIAESSFNSYQQNPEYIKSMLILEAMRLMLTEIAPKRRRKAKMNESNIDQSTQAKPTLSMQLSFLAKKVPQTSEESAAFSNALASIADKVSTKTSLDPDEKSIMSWLKDYPKPISNVAQMLGQGVEQFGHTLMSKRQDTLKSWQRVPDETEESVSIMKARPTPSAAPGMDNVHEQLNESDTLERLPGHATFRQAHHYEYQASMARSELYRNGKYAMSMLKQVDPNGEIQPWIAGCLTKSANILDKVYHYLDYYKTFEPDQLPEDIDGDMELGETSGSVARENLMLIIEYSTKLFNMIKPGDKLEGWVAMKLTTASECISSSKHYMDYVQFEHHALDDHFDEARKAKKASLHEAEMAASGDPNDEQIAKATLIINAKALASKVQDMAEDVAKMGPNDLMPLVDAMRSQFGQDAASGFNETVKTSLDELLQVTTKTKESIDNAVTTLQSGGVPATTSDIEQAGTDTTADQAGAPPDDSDISADLANLGNTEEEPDDQDLSALGREKKPTLESKMTCKECGMGTYMEGQDGKMRCDECGSVMIHEMKTGSYVNYMKAADRDKQKHLQNIVSNIGNKDEVVKSASKVAKRDKGLDTAIRRITKKGSDVDEAWDAKMHTAKKDIGKWDGFTLADLKSKKAKLMKKASRTEAEQKIVSQLNFAIRAKQKDHWGKIKEEDLDEAKKSKPDFLDVDKDGNKKESFKKALADKKKAEKSGGKKVEETWPGYKKKMANQTAKPSKADTEWNKITKINSESPVVEGIFSRKPKAVVTRLSPPTPSELAKKDEKPLRPGEIRVTPIDKPLASKEIDIPAYLRRGEEKITEKAPPGMEDFVLKLKKQYPGHPEKAFATAWSIYNKKHKKDESYNNAVDALAEAKAQLKQLNIAFESHKVEFKQKVLEGLSKDPLKIGYGLEGDAINQQISMVNKKIAEQKSIIKFLIQEGLRELSASAKAKVKASQLAEVKNTTPYGVIYTTVSGKKSKKLFENSATRSYWLELNKDKLADAKLIEPETFDAAIKRSKEG